MRYLFILLFAVACFSCTKTKIETKTITTHDTTIVIKPVHDTEYYHMALIGSWHPITTGTASPLFTLDSVSWNGTTPYRYVASGDTLYRAYSNSNIYPEHYYTFSKNYDTLTMYELSPYTGVLKFTH